MTIEIGKGIGFDVFRKDGFDVLTKTLQAAPAEDVQNVILNDLQTMLSQLLNDARNDPNFDGRASMRAARLLGYLQGLSEVPQLVAFLGATYTVRHDRNMDQKLAMNIKLPERIRQAMLDSPAEQPPELIGLQKLPMRKGQ